MKCTEQEKDKNVISLNFWKQWWFLFEPMNILFEYINQKKIKKKINIVFNLIQAIEQSTSLNQ